MGKLITTTALCFLFFGTVFAQEKINQVNTQGERTGIWKKYYTNNNIRYEGRFENGKEIGVFKFYSPVSSDFPVTIKTFENGYANVQFFNAEGVLESTGKMQGKSRVEKWVYYHKNGESLMIEEAYQKGKLSGDYKVYFKNGAVSLFTHYQDGKLHGNQKRYSLDAILTEDVNYRKGILNGPAVFYEPNGTVKSKGRYEADLKVGIWEFYMDGELSKSKEIINRMDDE